MSGDLPTLLLVDDDSIISETLKYVLSEDYQVLLAEDRKSCIRTLSELPHPPDLALIDLGLPPDTHKPDEGFAVIEYIRENFPEVKNIVLSGQDDNKYVEAAKKLGALDFVSKPCDVAELKARLKQHWVREVTVEDSLREVNGIIGESPAVELLRMQIVQLADSPFPVLIQGESGSGKELAAQNLHHCSKRAGSPFLILNCAAFNGELLESQLFGHRRGAFTGATETKSGFFEDAADGTLFLDEVAELPFDLQAKLLRVLENGEYYRLGETQPRKASARILAASNKDLLTEVGAGRFREDLYYRLSVLSLRVPPLRERNGDKVLLLEHLKKQMDQQLSGFEFDAEAMQQWMDYDFPGNVRELRNIIIRLTAKYPGQTVKPEALQQELNHRQEYSGTDHEREMQHKKLLSGEFELGEELKRVEKCYIDLALEMSGQNMSRAAELLGVNRSTLYGRLGKVEGGVEKHHG